MIDTPSPQLEIFLESEEFYHLMQEYRHAPVTDQSGVVVIFSAIKEAILDAAGTGRSRLPMPDAPSMNATGETSDGYHTFNELYAYRETYNALLFNEWAAGGKYDVHKSLLHSDGEPCFGGGWFIVVAQTPFGQVSNHYKLDRWDVFRVPERPRGAEWDGHTPAIALERLKQTAALVPAEAPAPLKALIAKWRALSQEQVYPYGKLMFPFAQQALSECADELEAALARSGGTAKVEQDTKAARRLDDELVDFLAAFHGAPDRATLLRCWAERTFDEVELLRAFCTLKPGLTKT